jgi:hypothetical protein
MIPKQTFVILAFLSLAPAVHAQGGLSDMFRSVTGALRGQPEPAPQPKGVTATIGVRGMDEADVKAGAATPASGDYAKMEAWAATRSEAESAAARKGLAARQVALRAKDVPNAPANN